VFVGFKMIAEAARHTEWLAAQGGWDAHAKGHLVHPALSLAVIVALIGTSVAASLMFPEKKDGVEIYDDHDTTGTQGVPSANRTVKYRFFA
jgi:predicted tellurium resistance membrane protein TerC